MSAADDLDTDLGLVRDFLVEHYRDEPSDDRAATRALDRFNENPPRTARIALAFRRVIDAELPEGDLQRLAFSCTGRDLLTDDDARAYLEHVFEANLFDLAIDDIED
ncbi:hypothetical protein [Actinokineospora globicatena]|uniref:Uncharacterized protein n=1 Tax=Actinokineospora globicatena TaxID=103729 RepID=A0A9W6QFG8_9PSEU|nr:hypothetical protein [Actinokineospora globicatena]GLW89483.1 hypothetical protein Aglo03_02990 [Actinokineospora globicatena]